MLHPVLLDSELRCRSRSTALMPTSYKELVTLVSQRHEILWREIDSARFAFRHMAEVLMQECEFPEASIRSLRILGDKPVETEPHNTKRSDIRSAPEGYYLDFTIKIPLQAVTFTTFKIRFSYPISRQQKTANILLNGFKVSDPFIYTEQQDIESGRDRQPPS